MFQGKGYSLHYKTAMEVRSESKKLCPGRQDWSRGLLSGVEDKYKEAERQLVHKHRPSTG